MQMKKIFDRQASRSFSTFTYNVRHDIDKGKWITQEIRQQLDESWNSPQWKEKAKKNVDNRRSVEGPVHTGGSIPSTEHMKRLRTSPDVDPSCWDLFKKTHTRKGDGSKWVSSKSERIAVEYQQRIANRDSQSSLDDASSHQSDNNIFLDVVGGVDKKGRVYGLGQEGRKYKSTSQTSFSGVSQSEYEHMRTLVVNLTEENRALKTRLESHEEQSRSFQEQSRLFQEQMYGFMENISLGRPAMLPPRPPPPPHPPPFTNQDNEHNENEIDDEFDSF